MFDHTTFLTLLAVLHALDSITTYQAIKAGNGREGNKFVAALMRKTGSVKAGLWLAKLPALYIAWRYPTVGALGQGVLIAVYLVTVVSNYRIWKGR